MKNVERLVTLALLIVAALSVTACSIDLERNPDGSLSVESAMSAESLQSEIAAGIDDPLVKEFEVDMHDGYMAVSAARQLPNSDHVDELTFHLDLWVNDGHLAATIRDARLNNQPIDAERVATWNERIAERLERAGRRNANSTLQQVTITPDALRMTWRVETPRSRGS
jgi:hypothetical protein